jgi:hypothetical protein
MVNYYALRSSKEPPHVAELHLLRADLLLRWAERRRRAVCALAVRV